MLAIARPDLRVTLVEPLLRRTTYLSEVVDELALAQRRGRARTGGRPARRATFDVVTSRAVAPLGRLLDWSMPLVAPTGALVAMKGQSVTEEIATEASRLATGGCSPAEVLELGCVGGFSTECGRSGGLGGPITGRLGRRSGADPLPVEIPPFSWAKGMT